MNKPNPGSTVHVVRPRGFGGLLVSALLQAEAQYSVGIPAQTWHVGSAKWKSDSSLLPALQVPVISMTRPRCIARLLAAWLPWHRPRIIHLHSGRALLTPHVSWLRRLIPSSSPLVVSLHGPSRSPSESLGDPESVEQHIVRSRLVSAIVVPSDAERERQLDLGLPAQKLFVVPDIVEPLVRPPACLRQVANASSEDDLILSCGTIYSRKRPLELIDAFGVVAAKRPSATLVFAGDGPLLPQCRRRAAAIPGQVTFLGFRDAWSLYPEANVFVALSQSESFGMAAMEAAYAKVPMVLSRIRPWTDHFTSGESCLFVDASDKRDVAAAILRLLEDRDFAARLADNAYKIVSTKFTRETTLAALSEAYEYALTANAHKQGLGIWPRES